MAGISSNALAFGSPENRYKYNGIEKESDLQIEVYDAQLRELDGQTGRWWQIDPKTEKMEMWSAYASNYDNPLRYTDPKGDEGQECCKWLQMTWDYTKGRAQGIANTLTSGIKMQIQVATVAVNYATDSKYRQQVNTQIQQAVTDPLIAVKTGERIVNTVKATVNNAIVAFEDPQSYTPQNIGKLVGTAEGTVLLSMVGGNSSLITNSVRNGTKVAEEVVTQGITQAEYTFTKTAAKHLTDVVQRGENAGMLARPYMRSPLTIEEIMKAGKGVPDATFNGGMNWNVSGTFRGSEGTWQLGINAETKVIYHFNFISK